VTSTIVYQRSYFGDLSGLPLNAGNVYIGEQNKDPQTFPVACFWDSALTIAATQPLSVTEGYITNNGLRAPVYTAPSAYSIRVTDRSGMQVDYIPSAGEGVLSTALAASTGAGLIGTTTGKTVQELFDGLTGTDPILLVIAGQSNALGKYGSTAYNPSRCGERHLGCGRAIHCRAVVLPGTGW